MDGLIETGLEWKTSLVFAWLILMILAQIFFARVKGLYGNRDGAHRLGRNLGLIAFNAGLSPTVIIPLTLLASQHSLGWRPETLNPWMGLVIDILILDFFIYWWHRANHTVAFLWSFHEIHHMDTKMDITTAIRFHFGEVLLSGSVRAIFIILADIPFTSVIIAESLLLMAALFHHANWRLPMGLDKVICRLIVTPDWHARHHQKLQSATDSNYGNILTLWDRLFGSMTAPDHTRTLTYGVEGIKQDHAFLRLVFRPFRKIFGT